MENASIICEESTRPTLCSDEGESFFNWVTRFDYLTIKKAQGIATGISNKIETLTAPMLSQQLRISPVATISQRLCLAFYNIFLDKLAEVGNHLKEATQLIQEAYEKDLISKAYVKGLRYLLNDLNASLTIKLADSIVQDEEIRSSLALGQIASFGNLPASAHAVITGVHAFFAGSMKQSQEEIQLFRRVTKVDPANIEWTVGLHRALRTARKDKVWKGAPSAEEKEAVVQALRLNKDHFLVKLRVCIYLKDVITSESVQQGSLSLGGGFQFHSLAEANEQLKFLCNEIIESEDMENSLMANLTMADVIGRDWFADPKMTKTKKCLDNALKLNPKSSKANHLRGRLVLHTTKDHEEALVYLKRAFDYNQSNSAALNDIIHLLLQKPKENSKELEAIFEEYVVQKGNQWPTFRLATLLFQKGLYHYMIKEKKEALRIWNEAYKIDSGCLSYFKNIWRIGSIFEWDRKLILISEMIDYMQLTLIREKERLPTEDSEIISEFLELGKLQSEHEKKEEKKTERRNWRISQASNRVHVHHFPNGAAEQPTQQPKKKGDIDNWRSGDKKTGSSQVNFRGFKPFKEQTDEENWRKNET